MEKMIITDLDNTLYDWVTFFAKAFGAMIENLSEQINVERETLQREFKTIHQKFKNTELPFAILELPSVKKEFPNLRRMELLKELEGPLYRFNLMRKKHLKLYDSVDKTLEHLYQRDFKIVGHTEAIMENAFYRLKKLGIKKYFNRLYVLEGKTLGHPNIEREKVLKPEDGFVKTLPPQDRKPNPIVLSDICKEEGVKKENSWYVGDSLTKDILMAKKANVESIWARYGTQYDQNLWGEIVKVSHWTQADIDREENIRLESKKINPDFTIDCFSQIIKIVERV